MTSLGLVPPYCFGFGSGGLGSELSGSGAVFFWRGLGFGFSGRWEGAGSELSGSGAGFALPGFSFDSPRCCEEASFKLSGSGAAFNLRRDFGCSDWREVEGSELPGSMAVDSSITFLLRVRLGFAMGASGWSSDTTASSVSSSTPEVDNLATEGHSTLLW